jgi:hypothetical protein
MIFRTRFFAILLALTSSFSCVAEAQADAKDTVGYGNHQHGKAVLMLVLEGNEMQLALQSAAQNIIGFEQKANTTEQRAEISAAIAVFERGDWFQFDTEANCELVAAEANTDLLDAKFHRDHADFYANYQLLCQQPARLKHMQLQLFNLLPNLQSMQLQWSINGQQGAAEASLEQSSIRF